MYPAVEAMLADLVPQARALARKYHARAPHALEFEELVSVALGGLMTAATAWEDYCERNGYSPAAVNFFGAYAMRRMRGAIIDHMRAQDWLTRSARSRATELQGAGMGLGATEDELESATGYTPAQIRSVTRALASRPVSMDAEPCDVQDEQEDVAASAGASLIMRALVLALTAQPPRVQVVIALRYYEGMDFPEITEATGLPAEAVESAHDTGVLAAHRAMAEAASG